jgi:hypothetical protein
VIGSYQLTAYVAAAALVLGGIGGYSLRGIQAKAERANVLIRAEKERAVLQAKLDEQSVTFEEWRTESDKRRYQSTNTIREIYQNAPPVSADCAPPVGIVGLLNGEIARANAGASGQPIGAVSKPAGG